MNKRILKILESKSLAIEDFENAISKAQALFEGHEIEIGDRIFLNIVMSYQRSAKICDVGGGVNLYPLALKLLGMDVTIVDKFPEFSEDIEWKIDMFRKQGIKVINSDAYEMEIGENLYDVVTSFECLEHLAHSPKPVVTKMFNALKSGGHFVISVPNIARIENRFRMLIGRTPLEKYHYFYHNGNPFHGHHREMTTKEVKWLINELGLKIEKFFTTDLTVVSRKKRSWIKRTINKLNYKYSLTDKIIPNNMLKHIWVSASKS